MRTGDSLGGRSGDQERHVRKASGMTLIELMIVVAVVALLAGIAYPSYRSQVMKSHRAEGKSALMQTAQVMERCFTTANTFATCGTFPASSEHGRYQITAARTATTYVLTAAPQGPQANDKCGTLTYSDLGVKTKSGSASFSECW
jgi:type IV pilus assembly protein PilE